MLAVVITLGVVILAAVITFALVAARKGRVAVETTPAARPVGPKRVFDEPVVAAPAPLEDVAAPVAGGAAATLTPEAPTVASRIAPSDAPGPAIAPGWSAGFDKRSQGLDDTARLRLIGDLGVIASAWCVPLLCRAYEEEQRPANRQAALTALAACRSDAAVPTYRLALASDDPAEAAIAADALADLEPPAASRQRTVANAANS